MNDVTWRFLGRDRDGFYRFAIGDYSNVPPNRACIISPAHFWGRTP